MIHLVFPALANRVLVRAQLIPKTAKFARFESMAEIKRIQDGLSFVDPGRDLRINGCRLKLKESIKERLPLALLTATLGLIAGLLASIYHDALDPFLQSVLPAINNKTLLLLCLLLFLVCVILAAWVCILVFGDEKNALRNQYRFNKERGFWIHKKTGEKVCAVCLVTHGKEYPLRLRVMAPTDQPFKIPQKMWLCSNDQCMEFYAATNEEIEESLKKT
ncbi:MAG: hypothetical protein WBN75_18930 [Verrucomicrobiia bacterium]